MIEAASLLPSLTPPTSRRPAALRPAGTPARTPQQREDGFPPEALLSERLLRAEYAIRTGQVIVARRLCAAAILDQMPLLAGSQPLLERTIAILLHCRAFGQISRLLAATQGDIVLFQVSEATECVMPPVGKRDRDGHVVYWLNARHLTDELADSAVRRWSAALVAGGAMVSHGYPLTSQPSRPYTRRVPV